MTYVLWIIQVLLALLFLFAGGTKLVLPLDVLKSMGSPNRPNCRGCSCGSSAWSKYSARSGLSCRGCCASSPG